MERFRIVLLVDLQPQTRHERKVAREFREALFKQGFSLLQEGVYTRAVDSRAQADSRLESLQRFRPGCGIVRAFVMTERQFEASTLLVGENPAQEAEIGSQLDIFL